MLTFSYYESELLRLQQHYKIPEDQKLLIYALGVVGETGEVVKIIKKHIRDDVFDVRHLTEELGDVITYATLIANYYHIDVGVEIEGYQEESYEIFEGFYRNEELAFTGYPIRLAGSAAKVSREVQLSLEGLADTEMTLRLKSNLIDIFSYVALIAGLFGINFVDIFNRNLIKLADKAAMKTLQTASR